MTYESIVHYQLPHLVPGLLALHRERGILAQLSCEHASPLMHQAEAFAAGETRVLVALFECSPHYCSYALAYVSFYGGPRSAESVAKAAEWLEKARVGGQFQSELAPIRQAAIRISRKLHAFGLTVLSLHETGYLLARLAPAGGASGGIQQDRST